MRPSRFLALAAATTIGISGTDARARDNRDSTATKSTLSQTAIVESRRIHSIGDLRMSISNDGRFGSNHGGLYSEDAAALGLNYTPAFEFPAASRLDYLFTGSLWIAGIVGEDTLVSLGHEGWAGYGGELWGFSQMNKSVDSMTGHERFTSSYQDTLVLAATGDPDRPGLHKPLGLEITQTSHAFQSPPYDRFVIAEYSIRNIGADSIRRASIGFFTDADVWQTHGGGDASDDLSGYLASEGIAYSMDNDGDPEWQGDWRAGSARGAFGIVPLACAPAATCTTFNWWRSDGIAALDWGPRKLTDNRGLGHGGNGTPSSDRAKYFYMSNGEIDYDQLFSAINYTAEGWRPPAVVAQDIANGGDTRFVLAFGAYDLAPGDSVRIAVAYIAGDSVHQNATDFANYFSATNPQAYYDHLDFDDLIANAGRARFLYSNGFDLQGAPPTRVWCAPAGANASRITWTAAPFHALGGYRLYRHTIANPVWSLVMAFPPSLHAWEDDQLQVGQVYEYAVSSVDSDGVEGPKSRPALFTAGQPTEIPEIQVQEGLFKVTIDWTAPGENPGLPALRSVNVYRRTTGASNETLLGQFPLRPVEKAHPRSRPGTASPAWTPRTTPADSELSPAVPPFVDTAVIPGTEYSYSASFTNTLGIEGRRSPGISATPMAFDRPGIVMLHTYGGTTALIDLDSVRVFYSQWVLQYGFDTVEFDLRYPPAVSYAKFSMQEMSHYNAVVVVIESVS